MRPALLLLAAPLLAGCPNTDTAVFVDPEVTDPVVTVAAGNPFGGGSMSGSFTLSLHLGARASGPSQVSVAHFDLRDDQAQRDVLSLAVAPGGGLQFPVTVEPDTTVTVPLTFSSGTKLLSSDEIDALCGAAGGLIIDGAIDDSLQNTETPVQSKPFPVGGCP